MGTRLGSTVWFLDKRCGEDIKLVDESQMINMFTGDLKYVTLYMSCTLLPDSGQHMQEN